MTTPAHAADWPGEREPSHRDVASANERPSPALLSDFKRALMASDDAQGYRKLLQMNLVEHHASSRQYTYPLALLSQFPQLPPPETIDMLRRNFNHRCLGHVFFERFPSSAIPRESAPVAPLQFGMACLASVCANGNDDTGQGKNEAETLFSAGASLWLAMVEMDNTLARSIDMLLAAVLLVPCGVLATADMLRTKAVLLLPASLTIARRLRLHCSELFESPLCQRILSWRPLFWSLWLWDVIQALHTDRQLQVSTSEILSAMPSSPRPFQDVYRELVTPSGHLDTPTSAARQPLLTSLNGADTSRDDAFFLLLALLSDLITLRRSLGNDSNLINPAPLAITHLNPLSLFSAHSEHDHIQGQIEQALDRWHATFAAYVSPDILALYQFCRLYLTCPALPLIHKASTHVDTDDCRNAVLHGMPAKMDISDMAINHAWAVLDSAAACPMSSDKRSQSQAPSSSPLSLCSAWMPVVVFQSALIVWAKIVRRRREARDSQEHTSIRALVAFQVEIGTMQWPCCTSMVATLQRLMSAERR